MTGRHYQYQDLLDNVLLMIAQSEYLDESLNIAVHQLKDAVERHQSQETINAYVRQAMLLGENPKYASLRKYFKKYLKEQAKLWPSETSTN